MIKAISLNSIFRSTRLMMILLFSILVLSFSFSNKAFAATSPADETSLATSMCKVIQVLNGKFGKALAAFAIIFFGVGLFFGKVSWGMGMATLLAIGVIFGAPTIVSFMTDGTTEECKIDQGGGGNTF